MTEHANGAEAGQRANLQESEPNTVRDEVELDPDWHEAMEDFMCLQTRVAKKLDDACESVKGLLRSASSLAKIWSSMTRLFVLALFATWLIPKLLSTVPAGTEQSFAGMSASTAKLVAFSAFGLTFVVFANIWKHADNIIEERPRAKWPVVLVESIVVVPVLSIFIDWVLNYVLGITEKYSTIYGLLFSCLGVAVTLNASIVALIVLVKFGLPIPNYFVLLASDRIPPTSPWTPSSRDAISKTAIRGSYGTVANWPEAKIRRVRYLTQKKVTTLTEQVQTITPISGFLGLFGLLALVLSAEQVGRLIENINNFFAPALDDVGRSFLAVLVAGVIGAAVLGVFYLIRAHRVLRVLEIIDALCEIRLEACDKVREPVAEISTGSSADGLVDSPRKEARSPLHTFLVSLICKDS